MDIAIDEDALAIYEDALALIMNMDIDIAIYEDTLALNEHGYRYGYI